MINLICPDFIIARPFYEVIIPLVDKYPYIQKNNRQIYSVYGNYPGMIWAGGWANIRGKIALQEDVLNDLKFFNSYGVRLTLTLTNTECIKSKMLDTYCNLVCSLFNKTQNNSALIADPNIESHLRKYYPNINIHKSIVATKECNYPNNWEDYELVVLKRSANQYLSSMQLPNGIKDKLEILCNDLCLDNCPHLYDHYDADSLAILNFTYNVDGIICPYIKEKGAPFHQYFREHSLKTYISSEKIEELYKLGFHYFKISGRGNLPLIVDTVISYLIKTEYQSDVRQLVYHHILKKVKRNEY